MSDLNDLKERFRRAAELMAMTLTGAAGPEFDFVPEPGKWSIRQIAAHLADSELVGAMRFRRVLAEPEPKIEAYDQNAWAANLDYSRRKPNDALSSFRRIRLENYELLKDLPDQAFERKGIHSERGPLTLLQLLTIYTEHAEAHAAQLREVRAKYKEFRSKSK